MTAAGEFHRCQKDKASPLVFLCCVQMQGKEKSEHFNNTDCKTAINALYFFRLGHINNVNNALPFIPILII